MKKPYVNYNPHGLCIGEKIHLFSRQGQYTIKSIHRAGFFVHTDENPSQSKEWSDFKCRVGLYGRGTSPQAIERRNNKEAIRTADEMLVLLTVLRHQLSK